MNAIARELAIDLAEATFELGVHEHIAGKTNLLPDFLSRLAEPGSAKTPPVSLKNVLITKVERRDASWWRTWCGPEDFDELEVSRR